MRNIAGLKPTNRVFGYILYTLFVIGCVAVLMGCGSDEITGTGGNPPASEQLIYSLDSLGAYMPGGALGNDTLLSIIDAENIRITFDCETNADSVNAWASIMLTAAVIDSNNVLHIYLDTSYSEISLLNRTFSFAVNGSNFYGLTIRIQLLRISPFACFIRLKNIKIYKLI